MRVDTLRGTLLLKFGALRALQLDFSDDISVSSNLWNAISTNCPIALKCVIYRGEVSEGTDKKGAD